MSTPKWLLERNMSPPGLDELMARVHKLPNGNCWIWTGYVNPHGYGTIRRNKQAHRVSYELHKGPIPKGLVVDHLCRVRHCVNPDHLEIVTQRENCLRGVGFCSRVGTAKRLAKLKVARLCLTKAESE